MAGQFQPVRSFVMIVAAVFVICGVMALYTHPAAHGSRAEERAAYVIAEKPGAQALDTEQIPLKIGYYSQTGNFRLHYSQIGTNGPRDGFLSRQSAR